MGNACGREATEAFIAEATGRESTSDWIRVDQELIDRFADTTGDRTFIHVDPDAARNSGLNGTIAHGFLTLSLLAPMRMSAKPLAFPGVRLGYNYGFDSIRMLSPVPSGSRIRGHFVVSSIVETSPGQYRETTEVTVEIEGQERPALVATWLAMYVT